MPWYHALLLTIAVFAGIFAVIFVPLTLAGLFDRLVEGIRRKKHPDYFKLYDAAVKESFEVGQEFNRQYDRLLFKFKMWTDGLKEGECTNEAFSKKMSQLTEQYQDLCCWYITASQYIQDLWKQVDKQAKEEGFTWGIIYDNKCS